MKRTSLATYSITVLGSIFIDRITKAYAITHLMPTYTVNRFLSFDLVVNRGISWGMFHSYKTVPFVVLSVFIITLAASLTWVAYQRWNKGHSIFGEVLTIAGALSNIVDRIVYGGVIDFIQLSYNRLVWPAFNVADVCIVVGVGIMLLQYYRQD